MVNTPQPCVGHRWILPRAQSIVPMLTVSPSILQGALCTPMPLPIILEERGKGPEKHKFTLGQRSPPQEGDFYQVVAPVRQQHVSYMILLLMPTLAVLPGIFAGISKVYTTLLPLFILEGRGKELE